MSKPLRFVILASGQGSNARNLIEHARAFPAQYDPCALISDRSGIPALAMAESFGVPTFVIPASQDEELLKKLHELAPAWAFLAGYKRIVSQKFLDFFYDLSGGFARVLNVHPSLLPAYPGLRSYERAFADGVSESGVTVHLVDAGMDTGRILLQERFSRSPADTLESFEAKGRDLEKKLFKQALERAWRGNIV